MKRYHDPIAQSSPCLRDVRRAPSDAAPSGLLHLLGPGGMLELHPVAERPFGVDGLLRDEAVAAVASALMHPVHAALVYLAPLVVVVWHGAVVGTAAVVVIYHSVNLDTVTHIHG